MDALGKKEFCFWQGKKAESCFISDVRTGGIYVLFVLPISND